MIRSLVLKRSFLCFFVLITCVNNTFITLIIMVQPRTQETASSDTRISETLLFFAFPSFFIFISLPIFLYIFLFFLAFTPFVPCSTNRAPFLRRDLSGLHSKLASNSVVPLSKRNSEPRR